jgi:hypothetical protein
MKQNIVIVLICTFFPAAGPAQEKVSDWGIKFSGYVKNDIYYDTRQSAATSALRDEHFYLYPDNVLYDAERKDINASADLHMLNIQTRLKGDITGPDAFGAKTSGVIEGEFYGTSELDVNGFRLRHAYVKMDWKKTILLVGQYWHPLFPAESFPGTLSFNTGAPFNPFSRNPQVRLTRVLGKFGLSLTAYSQRDFVSTGPDGSNNKYMKNSGIPGVNIHFRIRTGEIFTVWAGLDYKTLKPELKTTTNFKTNSTIGSYSTFANMKIQTKPVNISLMGGYAQNGTDLVMIGGYAVSEITDTVSMVKTYTNINTTSFWADITTKGSKVVVGLFTGYCKNLGANDDVVESIYCRGSNIDHVFRISPRIIVTSGHLSFGLELERTTAAYGTTQPDGRVTNTNNVTNQRFLLSTQYRF